MVGKDNNMKHSVLKVPKGVDVKPVHGTAVNDKEARKGTENSHHNGCNTNG